MTSTPAPAVRHLQGSIWRVLGSDVDDAVRRAADAGLGSVTVLAGVRHSGVMRASEVELIIQVAGNQPRLWNSAPGAGTDGEPLWSRAWLRQAGVPEQVVVRAPRGGASIQQWHDALVAACRELLAQPALFDEAHAVVCGAEGHGAVALLVAAAAGLPVGTLSLDGDSQPATAERIVEALGRMVPRLQAGEAAEQYVRELAAALDRREIAWANPPQSEEQ